MAGKASQVNNNMAAESEVQPKHRYAPSQGAMRDEGLPRWLRIPPLSPLRRLRRLPFWAYIAVLGPGIVSAAAGNDAGGIATYSANGAKFGYSMLWAMLLVTISLVLVQEMCARM